MHGMKGLPGIDELNRVYRIGVATFIGAQMRSG